MTHLRLGELLIKQGLITEAQLQKAIETQKKEKGRIGEILVRHKIITEENIALALGTQLGIPYYSSEDPELLRPRSDQQLEQLVTSDFAKKNNLLPLSTNMNSLTCAIADPLDLLTLDNLRKLSGYEINLVVATPTAIQQAINAFYHIDPAHHREDKQGTAPLNEAVENSYSQDASSADFIITYDPYAAAELSLDKLIEKAAEAPVIKLVDLIIRQAIDEHASDIHIEPFENKIHLRYRIDGQLYNIPPPSSHLHLAIVSRIKILAKLNIAEKRLPQDGGITAKLEDRNVDIRISTIPTVWGEKVVMRILDKASVPLELNSLGFESKQIDLLKKAFKSPHGLFFVTGPTGSGKTTTLYAALKELADPTKNTLTVEDPVEFKLDNINQVSVRPDIGLTFANALRAFLRQDPDIIMVGEVRDLETASICVRAALTGHLVLSSLHTNDAASAITWLLDIGVPKYLLTPSLIMIVAQRLAKKLCQKCKEPYEPAAEQHGGIIFKSDLIYRANGCDFCNNIGYKGRLAVAETLAVSEELRQLIGKDATYNGIKDAARKNGMLTLFESGIKLVEQGLTSFEEICRVTSSDE